MSRRISVVLPVYNEEGNIARCLRGLDAALAGHEHELLVCYDFDEDTTLAAIRAMPEVPASVRLVKNELGRGAANALRAGFAAATGDVVVTTMADLSDPPEVIPAMAREVRAGAAVVSGSRYMPGGSQSGGPWLKCALSRLAGVSMRWITGIGTHDPTSNFRAYSRELFETETIESAAGFEIALELTVKAHLAGRRVSEVPSSWVERDAGESRFQLWRWLPSYLRWYLRAVRAPLAAWGLLLALCLAAPLALTAGVTDRGLATALVAARAVPAALALLAARALRGRNTWVDLAHPLLWLLPVERWADARLGFGLPLVVRALASAALVLATGGLRGVRERARRARARRLAAPGDPPGWRTQGGVGVAVVALLLALANFRYPDGVAHPVLDPSWHQSLGRALVQDLRAGVEIVFTFGPLGYFNEAPYEPALYWTKILWWEGAFRVLCAVAIAWSLTRMRGPIDRVLFCAALFLPSHGFDSYYFLTALALTAAMLARPAAPGATRLGASLLLAVLALIKFTNLVLVVFLVGLVALHRLRARGPRAALAHVGGFALCVALVWTLCGQSLLDLPVYVLRAARVAGGYSEAMAVVGPPEETTLAAWILGLVAVAIAANVLAPRPTLARTLVAAGVAASVFLSFKAGFTRHGGNSVTFFMHTMAAPCLLFVPPRRATLPASAVRATEVGARVAAIGLALVGYAQLWAEPPHEKLGAIVTNRLTNLVHRVRDLDTLNTVGIGSRVADRKHQHAFYELPRVKAAVGDAPIDYVDNLQAWLFLNELSWHPRPVFQGYVAYTEALQELNARFYAGPDAPRFVLAGFEGLDMRMPTQSDALVLQLLARDWAPVLVDHGLLLLERRSDAPRTAADERAVVLERTARFGEVVDLSALEGECLLLELDLRYTALGKLRKTLLRAPIVQMESEISGGGRGTWRIVPGAMRTGAIVRPWLPDAEAWTRWYCGAADLRLERFRLRIPADAARFVESEFGVRVVRADALVPPPRPELLPELEYSMFATPPDGFRALHPAERRLLRGYELLQVRAPSELSWDLAPGRHRVRASFGMFPETYRRGGTDGATFVITVSEGGAPERALFERRLEPVSEPRDRPLQTADLELEVAEPARLFLRVHSGPSRHMDYCFWTGVEVSRAASPSGER